MLLAVRVLTPGADPVIDASGESAAHDFFSEAAPGSLGVPGPRVAAARRGNTGNQSDRAGAGSTSRSSEFESAPTLSGKSAPWSLEPGPTVEVRVGDIRARATPARLDRAALAAIDPGDTVTLALPDVGPLDVVVQRVTLASAEVTQLQGHLAHPVESYPVTLTLGRVLSFAQVTTPTGTWVAEFERGAGWVSHDDFADQLIDYGQSDARIPPAAGERAG